MKRESIVYIVDDDKAVAQSLADVVELIGLKVKSYSSGNQFLNAYKPSGPACLILDVIMPDMSGLELQKHLAAACMSLPTIVITGHPDLRTAVEMMKLGAIEFLEKPYRIQEMCDNIQKAIKLEEERWQHQEQRQKVDRRLENLTLAERVVMDLIVAGKTNKMIAAELTLSIRAVEDRRARMMRKLCVKSRAELLELVMAAQFPSNALPRLNFISAPVETPNLIG